MYTLGRNKKLGATLLHTEVLSHPPSGPKATKFRLSTDCLAAFEVGATAVSKPAAKLPKLRGGLAKAKASKTNKTNMTSIPTLDLDDLAVTVDSGPSLSGLGLSYHPSSSFQSDSPHGGPIAMASKTSNSIRMAGAPTLNWDGLAPFPVNSGPSLPGPGYPSNSFQSDSAGGPVRGTRTLPVYRNQPYPY